MNTRLIARLHDEFMADGYLSRATDPSYYPLPKAIPAILKDIDIRQNGLDVLDLGCGPGNLKEYTSFSSYTGVDVSKSMVRHARKAGYGQVFQSGIIPFIREHPDASFGGILCLSVAYFMPPADLEELLTYLRTASTKFWAITLDGITPDLVRLFQKERKIPLYNHIGAPVEGVLARTIIDGWPSPIDGKPIPMEVIVGKPGQ